MTDLSREIAAFERDEPGLIAQGHRGKWAAYNGDVLLGMSEERPLIEFVEQDVGVAPTLIRQIGAPSPTFTAAQVSSRERQAAEEMREACAKAVDEWWLEDGRTDEGFATPGDVIRALPLPGA